jgi:hypothetical protein
VESEEMGQNLNLQIENELEQIVEQINPVNKVSNLKSDLLNKMIFNVSPEFDSNLDQS